MKNLKIFFVLFLVSSKIISQPINNLTGDVTMPPPNVASFGKYTDLPVDLSTGIPSINIPIYTLSQGPLALDINLSYHSAGIRVLETASWVGTGWTLMTGGMISRTALGIPDEFDDGFYYKGAQLQLPIPIPESTSYEVYNNLQDGEPDQFSYSIPGYSGHFYLDYLHKPILVPLNDLVIKFNDNNTINSALPQDSRFLSFTITTPEGIIYHFGNAPSDTGDGIETIFQSYGWIGNYNLAVGWQLMRIESPDKLHKIEFSYENESISYISSNTSSFTRYWDTYNTQFDQPNSISGQCLHTTSRNKRITSINTAIEKITFQAITPREDITGGKCLNEIVIENLQIPVTFCKKYQLSYDYFKSIASPTLYFQKGLRLLSLQELACDASISIPPTTFEYEGNFLAEKCSNASDHWGYYNATGNAIPPTTLKAQPPGSPSITYGLGSRESNEAEMKKGIIKKILYPTGGHTSFVFEANDCKVSTNPIPSNVIDLQGAICRNIDILSPLVSFTSNQLINCTYQITHSPSTCSSGYTPVNSFTVQIWVGSSMVDVMQFNSENYETWSDNLLAAFSLQPNVNYRFILKTSSAEQTFKIIDPGSSYTSRKVGGLRIKEIRTSDGINSAKDIVKTYNYLGDDGNSSGKLYKEPVYGVVLSKMVRYLHNGDWRPIYIYYWSTVPVTPISSFNGRHVYYGKVTETELSNGSTSCKFRTDTYTNGPTFTYPSVPEQIQLSAGLKTEEKKSNQSGATVSSEKTDNVGVFLSGNDTFIKVSAFTFSGITSDLSDPIGGTEQFESYTFFNSIWQDYSGYTRINKHETVVPVYSKTEYQYNPDPVTYQMGPESETFTNSDGIVSKTEYQYVYSMINSNIKTFLISNNIIGTPVRTYKKVNNVIVDGSELGYSMYNLATGLPQTSSINGYPRIHDYYRYKATWNSAGVLINNGFQLISTIDSYDPMGFIKSLTRPGWNAKLFEWQPYGALKKVTFGNQITEFVYSPGSRFLSFVKGPDGTTNWYDYDKLWRLSKVSSKPSVLGLKTSCKIITDYTYQYKNGTFPKNFIKSQINYSPLSGSNLSTKELFQYFDELGRNIAVIGKQYSPSSKDVILKSFEYDPSNRPIKEFRPYEVVTSTTGAFYQIPLTSPHTLTSYEPSPLDRVLSVTPPSWYPTTYSYSVNTSNEVLMNGTNAFYPANTLYKETQIDPEGLSIINYTDLLGRVIMTRQIEGTIDAKTQRVYDHKNRLKQIIPPNATFSNTDLIFNYLYDGFDNMTYKKIPDAAGVSLYYNTRNLLAYTQDGLLAAQGKYLANEYDNFGRVIKTGFATQVLSNPSFNEIIAENFYDGHDGTSQVINLTTNPQYIGREYKTKNKILGSSSDWITETMSYDIFGNKVNIVGNNHLTLTSTNCEQLSLSYDYDNNILSNNRTHTYNSIATNFNERKVYDIQGRFIDYFVSHAGIEKKAANYNYDFQDNLIERNIHYENNSGINTFLQSVDYSYNAQGWMYKINNATLGGTNIALPINCSPTLPNPGTTTITDPLDNKDLFYQELKFDNLHSGINGTIQKNGNISQVVWRTRGRLRQAFSYTYDELNRIKTSTYYDVNDFGGVTASNTYNSSFNYSDLRGNISTLNRAGLYLNGSCWTQATLDNLSYSYTTNTNKLSSISEAALASQGGFRATSGGYTYDSNGNLKSDVSKGITNINYNHINLPTLIDFGGGKVIEFTYLANGQKIKKVVKNTLGVVLYTQHYIHGIEYRNNTIEALYHDEGRIYNDGGIYRREYFINDYLGNNRLVFCDINNNGVIAVPGEISQELHYDPFGYSLEGAFMNSTFTDNCYQYNRKELNNDFNLGMYDYGARMFSPGIGRFLGVDPIADEFSHATTFNYAENEPISNIDLWGLQKVDIKNVKDQAGKTIQRNVEISINLKILNLSSRDDRDITGGHQSQIKSGISTFNSDFKSNILEGSKPLSANEVPISVKFSLSSTMVQNISDVSDKDHLLVVVDQLKDNYKEIKAGLGEFEGNISMVESGTLDNNDFHYIALHELGHNLGLDFKGNSHSQDGKGLMASKIQNSLAIPMDVKIAMAKSLGTLGPFSHQVTHKNTLERAKSFFNENVKLFENSKAYESGMRFH